MADFETDFKEPCDILEPIESDGTTEYTKKGRVWCDVTIDGKSNLFSRVGVGARNAVIIVRSGNDIKMTDAISWHGKHLFITSIVSDIFYTTINAAIVTLTACEVIKKTTSYDAQMRPVITDDSAIHFPAVMTEKYEGFKRNEPYSTNTNGYIIVTPKNISLVTGDIVNIDSKSYTVINRYVLDEHKNEYEIELREDA
ncbi:MAG: hypothetical protein LKJ25_03115 [Clostridia bacterium]|jgi:hypothetical protein|nr:hypothetical protein [Clostridia bacterium]